MKTFYAANSKGENYKESDDTTLVSLFQSLISQNKGQAGIFTAG